jgi:hypothetical protein
MTPIYKLSKDVLNNMTIRIVCQEKKREGGIFFLHIAVVVFTELSLFVQSYVRMLYTPNGQNENSNYRVKLLFTAGHFKFQRILH